MNNQLLGAFGEQAAAKKLRDDGYRILSANFRSSGGELDIVAQKGNTLCFVEVKTRHEGGFLPPADAVDFHKQQNLKACAAVYLSKHPFKGESRFDIIEVLTDGEKISSVNHIINAF